MMKSSRNENAVFYIELLILYVVLFFSHTALTFQSENSAVKAASFSITAGIITIILKLIPSLALIWYIIIKNWKIEYWMLKPGRKDFFCGLFTLPVLLIAGFSIALVSMMTGEARPALAAETSMPSAAVWILICLTCIFSAYLEESFFRFYILSRREELNLTAPSALIFSSLLFALCHINAGPWGFLNAALSGLFLGFMFLRYNSLHGVAIAHGIYNIIAFIVNFAR